MTDEATSRPYRKVERARQEEETRRRITEAAVELHGTVGPARATVTDVAKLAGVSRTTVYNHFPTERDLYAACSIHWATRNPFPDPSGWAAIEDPRRRLVHALTELYEWYGLKQDMLGRVFRDLGAVPALGDVMEDLWSTWMGDVTETLARGWDVPENERKPLRSAVTLVARFETWQTLSGSGMDDGDAARLAARLAVRAFPPAP